MIIHINQLDTFLVQVPQARMLLQSCPNSVILPADLGIQDWNLYLLAKKEPAQMPQTIALVDDDRNILTSVSMTLEAEGFHVRRSVA